MNTFCSDSAIFLINFMQEVITTIFHCIIKHGVLPSLCIGENHRTFLEPLIKTIHLTTNLCSIHHHTMLCSCS